MISWYFNRKFLSCSILSIILLVGCSTPDAEIKRENSEKEIATSENNPSVEIKSVTTWLMPIEKKWQLHGPAKYNLLPTGEYGVQFVSRAEKAIFSWHPEHGYLEPIPLHSSAGVYDKIYSWKCIGQDSILILHKPDQLVLQDFEGKTIKEWKLPFQFPGKPNQFNYLQAIDRNGVPLLFLDGKVFFQQKYDHDEIPFKEVFHWRKFQSVEATVNLASDSAHPQSLPITYPKVYQDRKHYYDYGPYRCIGKGGELVYSFDVSDSLFVFDPKTGKTSSFLAKSQYFKTPSPYSLDDMGDLRKRKTYLLGQSRYGPVYYDPWRKFYYRVVREAIPVEKNKYETHNMYEKPWHLMVFDTSFNLLGEIPFDPAKYVYNLISIGPDGVMVFGLLTTEESKKRGEKFEADIYVFEIGYEDK